MEYQQKENRKPIGRIIQEKRPSFRDERVMISRDFTFYGVTNTQAGEAEISIVFKIIKADGKQLMIQYHELISPMLFDGVKEIELFTPHINIKITGKNLQNLYDYIGLNRLVWIKEPDSDFIETEKGEVIIENIEVGER